MTYSEAIQFLYDLRMFGAKLGLTNTLLLAELAGNPHRQLRFVHVAGTNGKGSTCAMLENIYREAGLRVGLFTSPHLVRFGERIQVNRQLMTPAQIVRGVERMQALIRQGWLLRGEDEPSSGRGASHPTFFEVVTVMALIHFAEQKCDLVVWETGLGGRLDATNIVTPLASVITNIQHDHEKWLGSTLPEIAAEKAGIIKQGVPVITATDDPDALTVIQQTASRMGAKLTHVTPEQLDRPPLETIRLPLAGAHQKMNAALAIATVRELMPRIRVGEEAIRVGLSTTEWAGRLQVLTRSAGQRLILDGAHNKDGARALAAALRDHFPGVTPSLVLGVLEDKDWAGVCSVLAPLAQRILLVPVGSERAAPVADLAKASRMANPAAQIIECKSVSAALEAAAAEPDVLVTGSLYLVGEVLNLVQRDATIQVDEQGLNEWLRAG